MSVVGIVYFLRGEVIDGIYDLSMYMLVYEVGILIVVEVNGILVWGMNFLDFYYDYFFENVILYFVNNCIFFYWKFLQVYLFLNSLMVFDVSGFGEGLVYYMEEMGDVLIYMIIYINVSDIILDNIIGEIYNFIFFYQGLIGDYMFFVLVDIINGIIFDGGWKVIFIEVLIVQYGSFIFLNSLIINFGNFSVDVFSFVLFKGVYVSIDGKEYQFSEENGGYYFYGMEIDQKFKFFVGIYNYIVVVVYLNGKEVVFLIRIVIIEGLMVDILFLVNIVYNILIVEVVVNVIDLYVIVINVKVYFNGKFLNLMVSGLFYVVIFINLINGEYKLIVIVNDMIGVYGIVIRLFVVYISVKVIEVIVNNEINVIIGVVGGSVNVMVENNIIVVNVFIFFGEFIVEILVVNNIFVVVVNVFFVDIVVVGGSNVILVVGWNVMLIEVLMKIIFVDIKGNKKVYFVIIIVNVSIGENGVVVVVFRDVNISKVYVIKNGQKVQFIINKSNLFGYYYKEGNVIFVVFKEDLIIVVQGIKEVIVLLESGIFIMIFNFFGYCWYNIYYEEFNEIYQKVFEFGVDNEIFQKVLEFYKEVEKYYEEVIEIIDGNIFVYFSDLRFIRLLCLVYFNEMKVVKLFFEVIEEFEVQG